MKMNCTIKKKMAKQRLKNYISYHEGSTIFCYEESPCFKIKKYYVLSKHLLDNSYYFVVSDEQKKIVIFKIINDSAFLEVPESSKRYLDNKDIFDTWIQKAKNKE